MCDWVNCVCVLWDSDDCVPANRAGFDLSRAALSRLASAGTPRPGYWSKKGVPSCFISLQIKPASIRCTWLALEDIHSRCRVTQV